MKCPILFFTKYATSTAETWLNGPPPNKHTQTQNLVQAFFIASIFQLKIK